jgi:hypothetical protein
VLGLEKSLKTRAGAYEHCMEVQESNPLEPGNKETKIYAPGVGLIQDGGLLLVKAGFAKGAK